MGEVIVDVGFTRGWEEGKPVLFDARASGWRVAGEFCERRVGFEGTEGGLAWRGGEEIQEGGMKRAKIDHPETEASIAGSVICISY